jgi:hypothetical protein
MDALELYEAQRDYEAWLNQQPADSDDDCPF